MSYDDHEDNVVFPHIVDRISGSGNGIIERDEGHVNIGPMKKQAVGEVIRVLQINDTFGVCIEPRELRAENYEEYINSLRYKNGAENIFNLESSDKPAISDKKPEFCDSCGSLMKIVSGEWKCSECDYCKPIFGTSSINVADLTESLETGSDRDDTASKTDEEDSSEVSIASPPDIGEIFTCELQEVNSAGNGILSDELGGLNIGPVDNNAVGKKVKIKRVSELYGMCLTEEVKSKNYSSFSEGLAKSYAPNNVDTIGEHMDKVSDMNYTDSEGSKPAISQKDSTLEDSPDQSADQTNSASEDGTERKQSIEAEEQKRKSRKTSSQTESSGKTTYSPDSSKTERTDDSIQLLREKRNKAEKAANGSPEREVSGDFGSRYNRSPAIKDYAKSRANGVCEYCEESAPFKTDSGEPYLEVHHVDELGEGGEDHPDKVVALCPNCHKEIHYGQQGDRINQNLQEKLEDGLAEVGK